MCFGRDKELSCCKCLCTAMKPSQDVVWWLKVRKYLGLSAVSYCSISWACTYFDPSPSPQTLSGGRIPGTNMFLNLPGTHISKSLSSFLPFSSHTFNGHQILLDWTEIWNKHGAQTWGQIYFWAAACFGSLYSDRCVLQTWHCRILASLTWTWD